MGFVSSMAVDARGVLYVPSSDRQHVLGISGTAEHGRHVIHDLSTFGAGLINTLTFYDHKIWVGYGDKILVIEGDKVSLVYQMSGLLSVYKPSFCIMDHTIYMANGEKSSLETHIHPTFIHPFLADTANTAPEDFGTLVKLKTAINLGLYCADGGEWIYAQGADANEGKLRLLRIAPR
jgi:hypothetical protein